MIIFPTYGYTKDKRYREVGAMNQLKNRVIYFNTLKTAVAAITAMSIAKYLQLDYAISAGTIAILSIQPTKKETMKTALGRFLAYICALGIAYICFLLVGINFVGFCIYLVIFIFVCQIFHWNYALVMSTVSISHFLAHERMDLDLLIREASIFGIGVCTGIIANLHLHRNLNYIKTLKYEADEQIRHILLHLAKRILDKSIVDDCEEHFALLSDKLSIAKRIADANFKNQFWKKDVADIEYISMREKQYLVLHEMYKSIRYLRTTPITAKKIANYLEVVATQEDADLRYEYHTLNHSLKSSPLPIVRSEFEDRARLFMLLRQLEEFLAISGILKDEEIVSTKFERSDSQ